jgi:Mn2+/Fe2+ NRAMP family transporter
MGTNRQRPAARPPRRPLGWAGTLGPGLALAATGVGAGDLVAAAVTGARYGEAVLWAALAGAALKLALNEGLARWQLATGTTLLEGWVAHLGRWVRIYFGLYLFVWSFLVGGALISACGLAAHAIVPALSVTTWGIVHTAVAAALVLLGRYRAFEPVMKVLVAVMVVTLVGTALTVESPAAIARAAVTSAGLPAGSGRLVLGVIGGVGGSLTLLSYGYWMRERGWEGERWLRVVRVDLVVAYGVTGLFGIALMVLATRVLHARGAEIAGAEGVVVMASMLGEVTGPIGASIFLAGFWAAVGSSMLGVWQGVPYLFCDFLGTVRGVPPQERDALLSSGSRPYRLFLLWLAGAPVVLLFVGRPVGVVVLYSIVGALFMPLLAGTLLVLGRRTRLVGRLRNGPLAVAALLVALALFAWIAGLELVDLVRRP